MELPSPRAATVSSHSDLAAACTIAATSWTEVGCKTPAGARCVPSCPQSFPNAVVLSNVSVPCSDSASRYMRSVAEIAALEVLSRMFLAQFVGDVSVTAWMHPSNATTISTPSNLAFALRNSITCNSIQLSQFAITNPQSAILNPNFLECLSV